MVIAVLLLRIMWKFPQFLIVQSIRFAVPVIWLFLRPPKLQFAVDVDSHSTHHARVARRPLEGLNLMPSVLSGAVFLIERTMRKPVEEGALALQLRTRDVATKSQMMVPAACLHQARKEKLSQLLGMESASLLTLYA